MLGCNCGQNVSRAVLDAGITKQKSDRHLWTLFDRMTMTIRPVGTKHETRSLIHVSHINIDVLSPSQAGRQSVLAPRNEQVAAMSLSGAHADKDLASRA